MRIIADLIKILTTQIKKERKKILDIHKFKIKILDKLLNSIFD
jgi:hypothetical protein